MGTDEMVLTVHIRCVGPTPGSHTNNLTVHIRCGGPCKLGTLNFQVHFDTIDPCDCSTYEKEKE